MEGDRGQGSVWLRDGTVMGTAADRAIDGAPAEEVLFELLRFRNGSFDFQIDELSPNGEQPEDVEVLLRDANSLLREWSELERVVPSLDHQVNLVGALPGKDVTIDADHWPAIVAVGTGRTVGQLASTLTLGELGVTRKVRDLVELGVVALSDPGPDAVSRRRETAPPPDPSTRTAAPRVTPRSSRSSLRRTPEAPPRPEPRPDTRVSPGRGGPFADLGSGEVLGTANAARGDTGELERLGWLQSDSGAHAKVPENGSNGAGRSNGLGTDDLRSRPNGASLTPPSGSPAVPAKGSGKRAGRAGKRAPGTGRSGSKRSPLPGPTAGAGAGETSASAAPPAPPTPPVSPAAPVSPPQGTPTLPSTPRLKGGRSGSRRSTTRPPSAPPSGGPASGSVGRVGGPTSGSPFDGPPQASSPFDTGNTPVTRPFDTGGMSMPPLYDTGSLGQSPLPDTGQIRPVSSSALPPDLHWAADDGRNGGTPFGAAAPVPPPAPLDPGKVAPHVAAMSPDARAAVQNTVGNHGGTNGGPAVGEDLADRGQLLNFLSSVRP